MTEIKYPKKTDEKPSISERAIKEYLSTTLNYNKLVKYSNQESTPQPDYSEMQGSHFWIN